MQHILIVLHFATKLINQGVDASRYGHVFNPPARAAALARNCNIVGLLSSSQSKNGQAAQDIQVAAIEGAFMGDHLNAYEEAVSGLSQLAIDEFPRR